MKNALLLLAVTFMAYPMMANTSMENPAPPQDCHAFACAVAEQGFSAGADIDDVYEMAYEMCNQQ